LPSWARGLPVGGSRLLFFLRTNFSEMVVSHISDGPEATFDLQPTCWWITGFRQRLAGTASRPTTSRNQVASCVDAAYRAYQGRQHPENRFRFERFRT